MSEQAGAALSPASGSFGGPSQIDLVNQGGRLEVISGRFVRQPGRGQLAHFGINRSEKVEFENLVVEGGDTTNDGTGASGPTNVLVGGKVTLTNVKVQGNRAVSGAGLSAFGGDLNSSGGSLTINGTLLRNAARGSEGQDGSSKSRCPFMFGGKTGRTPSF
jgi:hypothetical protein